MKYKQVIQNKYVKCSAALFIMSALSACSTGQVQSSVATLDTVVTIADQQADNYVNGVYSSPTQENILKIKNYDNIVNNDANIATTDAKNNVSIPTAITDEINSNLTLILQLASKTPTAN